jgi:phosphoethanolamine N-methyltransferase
VGAGSPEFQAYVKSTGYHLVDPAAYGKLLEGAGFVNVKVEDATPQFIEIMKAESDRLTANRKDFVESFSEADLDYLIARWAMKDGFCRAGDMKWGIFQATKPV